MSTYHCTSSRIMLCWVSYRTTNVADELLIPIETYAAFWCIARCNRPVLVAMGAFAKDAPKFM
jgi:hypothetical protein